MLVTRVKTFVSTRAELLDQKINDWIDDHPDDIFNFRLTPPSISYTSIKDKGAYMICCQAKYEIDIPDDPE